MVICSIERGCNIEGKVKVGKGKVRVEFLGV